MTLMSRIRDAQDSMTPTDKKIAAELMNNPEYFARMDTTTISEQYGFSQPALTRFAKKIGYSGYAEFKYDIARNKNALSDENTTVTLANETARFLKKTEEKFPPESLKPVIAALNKAQRIFVTGYHKSRPSAELMNISLINYRYPSQFIPYDEVFKLDAYCTKKDLLILFSVSSGIYKEIVKSLHACKERPRILLVTSTEKHPCIRYCDQVIVLPDKSTIHSPLSPDPSLTTIFWINLLSMALTDSGSK